MMDNSSTVRIYLPQKCGYITPDCRVVGYDAKGYIRYMSAAWMTYEDAYTEAAKMNATLTNDYTPATTTSETTC